MAYNKEAPARLLCAWNFLHEYWSGLPFATLGDHLYPGIEPLSLVSPALAGRFFTTELPGKPLVTKRLQSNMSLQKIEKERKKRCRKCYWSVNSFRGEPSSVKLSHSVLPDSLGPHGLQHAGLTCFTIPWSLLRFMSNELEMPSKDLILCDSLLLCLQSFPASRSFLISQLFSSGGQSIGASTSTLILPKNIQGWFPLRVTSLTFFAVWGTLKSILQHHNSKASILQCSAFFMTQLIRSPSTK